MIVRRTILKNQPVLIETLTEFRFKKERNISVVCSKEFAIHLIEHCCGGLVDLSIEEVDTDICILTKVSPKGFIVENATYDNNIYKTVDSDVIIVTIGDMLKADDFESFQAGKELVIYQADDKNDNEYARYALGLEFGGEV